jgi:hypothetical protein
MSVPRDIRYVNLVQSLRLARAILALPRWKVAREIGISNPDTRSQSVSAARLCAWETLDRQPRAAYLLRWAATLGVPL